MFNGLQLTNQGSAILTALLSGHTIKFTKIKMGDGNAPTNIKTLTDLVSTKQTLNVVRSSKIDSETILIGANLMGNNITEAFFWKEIGVFAQDITSGTAEVLFSYSTSSNATYIPVGGTVAEMLIDLNMKVGNATNIDIRIDSSLIFPTQQDVTNLLNTSRTEIDSNINDINAAINDHKNNKNNPHSVTKSQIGLENVENLGVADTNEAKQGSTNSKYMTPLRTKEAINAYSVTSDGNLIIKVGGSQPGTQSGKTIIWINTNS